MPLTDNEQAILVGAADIIRQLERAFNNTYQRTRDSQSQIELHKGRMAMEKAINLSRLANELNIIASTNGL